MALLAETATGLQRVEEMEVRFEFGKNWSRFIALVDEDRIAKAANSLRQWLEVDDLEGKSFLDVGSGSGLYSLAARRLGARVHSFDYDSHSVACTAELKRRYFPRDLNWTVEQGSALDADYLRSLGTFDVVYSWGVLHHTGQMWRALDNVQGSVEPGGKLFIAIYNDMGSQSTRWRLAKRVYNQLPRPFRLPFALVVMAPSEAKSALRALATFRVREYVRSWIQPRPERGMSRWRDIIDWVGGYPYEVARPEEIFEFCRARGLALTKMQCGGVGLGCNQFVFARERQRAAASF
ncbi:MAG TPA: class I SAM-dependent methyltransferase [Blastocatellia bacterium]|nr:class I SAM-dependent methyltransferase [Blastocatellia bacterium]